MFTKDHVAKGDVLFKEAISSYEKGQKQLEEKNKSDLLAADEAEKAAKALREKVTVDVAERNVTINRIQTAIGNIKQMIGIE